MPVFFVIAMSAFILAIVDLFRAPLYGGLSLVVWYAGGITPLGLGVDWHPRVRTAAAYVGMLVAAALAVMGAR